MKTCERCLKEVDELVEVIYNNEESSMLCRNCEGWEHERADMEYERQKEDGCESDRERDQEEI
jgi:hypothetical protein